MWEASADCSSTTHTVELGQRSASASVRCSAMCDVCGVSRCYSTLVTVCVALAQLPQETAAFIAPKTMSMSLYRGGTKCQSIVAPVAVKRCCKVPRRSALSRVQSPAVGATRKLKQAFCAPHSSQKKKEIFMQGLL